MSEQTERKFSPGSYRPLTFSRMIPEDEIKHGGHVEYHLARMIHWDQERKLALSLGQVKYAQVCATMYNLHRERARKMI